LYLDEFKSYRKGNENKIIITDFITRMDCAYQIADVIVSRAGGTIAELAIIGKPSILLPSANVTEDHQTKNVMALVSKEAAILVKDSEADEQLIPTILNLLNNEEQKEILSKNFKQLAKPNAAEDIAKIVTKVAQQK